VSPQAVPEVRGDQKEPVGVVLDVLDQACVNLSREANTGLHGISFRDSFR